MFDGHISTAQPEAPRRHVSAVDMNDYPVVLIVDETLDVANALSEFLGRNGFDVLAADRHDQARHILLTQPVELVILGQIGLERGMELARLIPNVSDRPTIVVAQQPDEIDRILALERGADDLVAAEANPRVLVARMRAILRRARKQPPATSGWLLDARRRVIVTSDNRTVQLTNSEFEIMYAFSEARAGVVTVEDARGSFFAELSNPKASLRTAINRLRQKLDDRNAEIIRTISGRGYMLGIDLVQV
ncbi:MAG: response regulator transcription factor [Brevundimonas sp.]|nr:MAG: response regulator transcription factor [Brevundimonas sp.]